MLENELNQTETREEKMKAVTRKALFHEMHRSIEEAASSVFKVIDDSDLSYPPGTNLTVSEQKAIKDLNLSSEAKSTFRKIIMDACAYPCFHLLCLFDGVADPESEEIDEWFGLSLNEVKIEDESIENEESLMLHDEPGESYWEYMKMKEG